MHVCGVSEYIRLNVSGCVGEVDGDRQVGGEGGNLSSMGCQAVSKLAWAEGRSATLSSPVWKSRCVQTKCKDSGTVICKRSVVWAVCDGGATAS